MSTSNSDQLIDEAQIAELTEALGNDRVGSLLHNFGTEMESSLKQLTDSSQSDMSRSEWAELAGLAHHAAGSAALFGARKLRLELIAFEKKILSPNELIGNDEINSLLLTWKQTQPAIQELFQTISN